MCNFYSLTQYFLLFIFPRIKLHLWQPLRSWLLETKRLIQICGKCWSHIPYWWANYNEVRRSYKGHTYFKGPRTIIDTKDLWAPLQFALGLLLITYHKKQSTPHVSLNLCFSSFVNVSHDEPEENRFLPNLCVPYPKSYNCLVVRKCCVFSF